MTHMFRPRSQRGILLGTAALASALVLPVSAQAATLNSQINVLSASIDNGNGGRCRLSFSGSFTGVNNDNGLGNDFIVPAAISGGVILNSVARQVGVGQTFTVTTDASPPLNTALTAPVQVAFYEATTSGVPTTLIATANVPNAMLQNAGGACTQLIFNQPPVANAGADATVSAGATVPLTGSGTDPDNDPLTYQWTQTAGPTVTILNPGSASASFVAPASTGSIQTLTFALVASDGTASSAPDSVTFTIPANSPPTVNAGADLTRPGGSAVVLEGNATDPEADPMTFQWTQTGGPSVSLNGATTLVPSFTAPPKAAAQQVLTFSLTASDGTSTSAPDTVDVIIPANTGPTANAGSPFAVAGGDTVALSGSASTDGDGDTLSYSWVQTAGPPVTLTGANTANASFVAPLGLANTQQLTFELTVSDGVATSVASNTINVYPNSPPVANAGPDQGPINSGQTITLNGSGSSDPDNNSLTYQWTQVSGPPVTLSGNGAINPTFVAPNVNGTQNLVFQLVVSDGIISSAPDTVTIAVRAVGSVTIIQRIVGRDQAFSFTSSISALTGSVTTVNGSGQLAATLVPAGSHSVTAGDARATGFVLTSIVCNDSDSVVNLASRSVAIALSPNENLVCTFTSTNTRDAASTAIADFLTARNAAILSSQPDLQRRMDRLTNGAGFGGQASIHGLPVPGSGHLPLTAMVTDGSLRASTSLGMARAAMTEMGEDTSSHALDIWAEAQISSLRYPGHRGRFSLYYVGADYRVADGVLVGALAQFDRFSPRGTLTPGTASGDGWMAGPYLLARLAPNLYFDGRAAWGRSDNRVSPLGTYRDAFDTTRGLYSGALIGAFPLGTGSMLRPELRVRYLGEHQKAYLDSNNVAIPAQTIGQGDISFRPRFQHDVAAGNGWTLRPFIEAEGIYSFGIDPRASVQDQFRMRIEGGTDIFSSTSFRASLSAFHDGIGGGGLRNSGARVTVGFSL